MSNGYGFIHCYYLLLGLYGNDGLSAVQNVDFIGLISLRNNFSLPTIGRQIIIRSISLSQIASE